MRSGKDTGLFILIQLILKHEPSLFFFSLLLLLHFVDVYACMGFVGFAQCGYYASM